MWAMGNRRRLKTVHLMHDIHSSFVVFHLMASKRVLGRLLCTRGPEFQEFVNL
mgnify:CR=1 FL=1